MMNLRSGSFRFPSVSAIGVLVIAALAGYAAQLAHVPLAWILGPLITTAVAAMTGFVVFAPLAGRRLGQVLVGTSIGLNITAPVLLLMVTWLPVMVLTSLVGITLAAVVSVPFASISGTDKKTAYFSMMPGGLSEMANLGAAAGAQSEPIAISQALRVALLVCVLPPLIIALDIHGTTDDMAHMHTLPLLDVGLVIMMGLSGVGLARLAGLNNPWMIGALTGAGVAAATGLFFGRLPQPLYWFGQFMIGISIGARFKREIVGRLARVVIASTIFILLLAGLLFGYAAIVSGLSELDLASATLGASPGGLAEMAITAQTLHLSVGLVTGFHVVRAFIVNAFATRLLKIYERVGLFAFVARLGGSTRRQ
jgi:membrane AbrB-like protein